MKITEKTLTEIISQIVLESQERIITEAPLQEWGWVPKLATKLGKKVKGEESATIGDRIGKCQAPTPWRSPGLPLLKKGDKVGQFFKVTDFNVTQGQAQTRVYISSESAIHVYADEILSLWDGAQPFNFTMELTRTHDASTPSFEQWADDNPANYRLMPYKLLEDLGFKYCGPVRKGKKETCSGGEWLYTSLDDTDSWAMKPKKLVHSSKKEEQADFRNYSYQWEIPESLLPEGYDWKSIGKKYVTWDKKKKIILDGEKVIKKFFGGDWKKAYPWVMVDINQTGMLGAGAGGAGIAYQGSDRQGTTGKHNMTIRQNSENLKYVKEGLTQFRENYGQDLIDVTLLQNKEKTNPNHRRTSAKGDVTAGISITVSNNPEIWQISKSMQLKGDSYLPGGFQKPQDGEWARKSCVQLAQGDVGFSITSNKQNSKFSDYTVNNKYYSANPKTKQMAWFSRGDRDTATIRIYFHIKYNLGIQGEMQRELWIKDQPYDKNTGRWLWEKSDINWSNWTLHTWLEVGAIAVLIIGGVFTGGATWYLGALYITMNTVNALIYFAEGNYGMGGLILLFDFIPGGHFARGLGKVFKTMAAPAKAISKVTQSTKILYSGGFKKFNTVLKQLGGSTDNLIIARALAETGESGIKSMKKAIVNIERNKITKEMTEEFLEKLAKESPDLAAKLTPEMAEEVMKQQRNRVVKYMDNVINGGTLPIVIGEAIVLLTLYDTNMVSQLLHEFVWKTPVKDRNEMYSFSKSVTDGMSELFAGETWLDEWYDWIVDKTGLDREKWFTLEKTGGGMSDIVNSTPCTEEDKERETEAKSAFVKSTAHLQAKFYPWCVGDRYNWQSKGPALQYCAATSTDTFKLEHAKLPQDCEYIEKSHYGVGVASGLMSGEFNRAMRTDWVDNGWRPGYCVITQSAENAVADAITGDDAIIQWDAYEITMQGVELAWGPLFYAASQNFKRLTTTGGISGEYLKISIAKKKYTITSTLNKKMADALCRLPDKEFFVVCCVMEYYRDLTTTPSYTLNPNTGQPYLNSTNFPGCLGSLTDVSESKLLKPSGGW